MGLVPSKNLLQLGKWSITCAYVLLAGVLFALSYAGIKAFLAGIIGTLVALSLLWFVRWLWRHGHRKIVIVGAVLAVLVLHGGITVFIVFYLDFMHPKHPQEEFPEDVLDVRTRSMTSEPTTRVEDYHVIITPAPDDDTLSSFQIEHQFKLFEEGNYRGKHKFKKTLHIERTPSTQGWLLREAVVPLKPKVAKVTWLGLDGQPKSSELCCFRPATIVLKDFPEGVFHQGKDIDIIDDPDDYGKTEEITGTFSPGWFDNTNEVRFLMVPPPFNFVASFVPGVVNISSWSEGTLTLLGIVGTFCFVAFQGAFMTIVKGRLQGWMGKKSDEPEEAGANTAPQEDCEGVPVSESPLNKEYYTQQLRDLREKIDALLQQLQTTPSAQTKQISKKISSAERNP